MACAWKNPKCRIGMIIGTGTNACCLHGMGITMHLATRESRDGQYTHSCVLVVVYVFVCMSSVLRIVNGTSTEARDVPDSHYYFTRWQDKFCQTLEVNTSYCVFVKNLKKDKMNVKHRRLKTLLGMSAECKDSQCRHLTGHSRLG
jgi:hypothetical protein